MDYIRDILLCFVSAVFGLLMWKIQRWQEKQEKEMARREKIHLEDVEARAKWQQAITDNAVAMSRYHLMRIYRYAIQVGYIYPDQLAVFESLYDTYHALGGNGMITAYREHLLELPSSPETIPAEGNWRA